MNSYSLTPLIYPSASGDKPWHMSHAERCAVLQLLRVVKPGVALEIGTCDGGCLDQIREYARFTYSIDIDPAVKERLARGMPNVEFHTGNSPELVGRILQTCQEKGTPLEFALVDGDHRYAGVRADLQALLKYHPTKPLWILMHDSSNPECRRGIADAGWAENPHVHLIDLDFVLGGLGEAGNFEDQLWGGIALAVLRPETRIGGFAPVSAAGKTYDALYRASIHFPTMRNRFRRWWRVKKKGLQRRLQAVRA